MIEESTIPEKKMSLKKLLKQIFKAYKRQRVWDSIKIKNKKGLFEAKGHRRMKGW